VVASRTNIRTPVRGSVLQETRDSQEYIIDYNSRRTLDRGWLPRDTSVTIVSGAPSIDIVRSIALDPFAFPTGFGTHCAGSRHPISTHRADLADPCGVATGYAATGAILTRRRSWRPQQPPNIAAPRRPRPRRRSHGDRHGERDGRDAANNLTITQSGSRRTDLHGSAPGASPRTATITGTPGFADAGTTTSCGRSTT